MPMEHSAGEDTCSKSFPKEISSEPPLNLTWKPFVATEQAVVELWDKLKQFPILFDDFTKDDFNTFVAKLMSRNNIFIDIGDGKGLACGMAARPGLDMVVHLAMFDKRLRGREPLFMEIMNYFFTRLKLRRMTTLIVAPARTASKLAERVGFHLEGVMREASIQNGQYVDVEVWGILREEFDAKYQALAASAD